MSNPYKVMTKVATAIAIASACACSSVSEDPELEPETCTAPPGFYLQFNKVTKHWGWCFDSGFCPTSSIESSRAAALKSAWSQYEHGKKPHVEKYDPDKDEGNWGKVVNPCAEKKS